MGWTNVPALYSNTVYLDKYNKTIPTTWNELLETSKFIINEEKKKNNTDLIPYNGLFHKNEAGTCSILEFIYSYRNSVNDTLPDLTSQEAIEALEMIKKIKDEIATDDIFRMSDLEVIPLLYNGKALFLKYWYLYGNPVYERSILPGAKEGISGACIGGTNIAVSRYSNNEKTEAAVKASVFMASKEAQKKYLMQKKIISCVSSLYDDPEVCQIIDCNFYKKMQPFVRPTLTNKYYEYSESFKEKIYQYLYDNIKSPSEVLNDVNDITRIYYISLSNDSKTVEIIALVLLSLIITSIIISISFLFIEKFKYFYYFLPKYLWIITLIGIILFTSSGFAEIGEIVPIKCHLKAILLSLGFTLSLIPMLYKLIIIYPNKNKLINFIKDHRYLFLLFFISIDFIFLLLTFISPYEASYIKVVDGKSFQKCQFTSAFGKTVLSSWFISKFIITSVFLYFIFIYWNIKAIHYDIRFLSSAIYINILLLLIYIIIDFIEIKNYIYYFLIKESILIIFAISNYITLYGIKAILIHIVDQNTETSIVKNVNVFMKQSNSRYTSKNVSSKKQNSTSAFSNATNNNDDSKNDSKSNSSSFSKNLLDLHYQTSLDVLNTESVYSSGSMQ